MIISTSPLVQQLPCKQQPSIRQYRYKRAMKNLHRFDSIKKTTNYHKMKQQHKHGHSNCRVNELSDNQLERKNLLVNDQLYELNRISTADIKLIETKTLFLPFHNLHAHDKAFQTIPTSQDCWLKSLRCRNTCSSKTFYFVFGPCFFVCLVFKSFLYSIWALCNYLMYNCRLFS